MAGVTINSVAALREPYPPPPSLFNLYGPDDGVSPLPPPPPPIPTPDDIAALREHRIELNVLGNPIRLQEDPVPALTTQVLYRTREDGSIDYKGELRRLTGELLFMFLELLKTAVEQPSRYAAPLTNINMLFANLLHLTNLLRPHQARATLEATLRLQVATLRDSIRRVRAQVDAADGVLLALSRALLECEGDTAESVAAPAAAAARGTGHGGGGPGGEQAAGPGEGAAAMEVEG